MDAHFVPMSLSPFVPTMRSMAAFLSAWMGLACLAFAVVMIFYGPALNSVTIVVELWGTAAAMTVAGLVFWAHRNEPPTTAIKMQRLQAGFGIGLAVIAAAIVYVLIIGRSTPVEPAASGPPAVLLSCSARHVGGTATAHAPEIAE